MKRMIRWLAVAAALTMFAVPAFSQAKECNDDNKGKWYDTFLNNYKGEPPAQKVAYDAAKNWLTCSPDDTGDIAKYLQTFVTKYEAVNKSASIKNQLEDANNKNNYAEVVRAGKQVLASEPDYIRAHMLIAIDGFAALRKGDPSLIADAGASARAAIQLIEAGKPFAPYGSKDQAVGSLNYVIAESMLKSAPGDAIPLFLKAVRLSPEVKKDWNLYFDLATAYEEGPRAKLTDEYKSKVGPNNTETQESKLVLENLNQVIDRQIDAYARAAVLTTDATNKKAMMDALTELYKFRNKSDTGLNEFVAGILSKPVPDVPTPLTSLPTPVATPTTTSGSQSATGNTGATNKSAGNGTSTTTGNKPGNTTTTTAKPAVAKPSPTPTPKPRSRAHHRRG